MLAYLTYLLYSYSFCNTLFHQSPLLIVFTTFAIHHSLTFSLFYTVKTRPFRRFTKLPQTNNPQRTASRTLVLVSDFYARYFGYFSLLPVRIRDG